MAERRAQTRRHSAHRRLLISLGAIIVMARIPVADAVFADFASVPRGTNPTLYDAEDFVVQLDDASFNDTVFCEHREEPPETRCTAMVVEFYSDWCGHCRAYARVYKALARDLRDWSGVLKLAAINCADPVNAMTCRAGGITHYPYIKFYPRNSSDAAANGRLLRSYQSMAEMRDQITRTLLEEYDEKHYADWPQFEPMGDVETYGELWESVGAQIRTLAVVFEQSAQSLVGAQLLLDLSKYEERLAARRCVENQLSNALQIVDFPTFAIFRRGERSPVYIAELRRLLLTEFEQFFNNETNLVSASVPRTFARLRGTTQQMERACEAEPERCKSTYFVSELDMLKSIRIALFNDIQLTEGANIAGQNVTALYNFVDLLANHFPYSTRLSAANGEEEHFLNASGRARVVFSHLRDFVDSRGLEAPIGVDEWKAEFLRAETDQGNPFPIAQEWEHCKGSSPVLRGFTCGLWTVFHALTVNAYKNAQKDDQFHPIALLARIRDWVGAFFACEHCRVHFLRMTTRTSKIESLVRRKEDVFLYLWRAHNLVNARLRGRETEDPQFPKHQFPARFLCPECRTNGTAGAEFNEQRVKQFLLDYYARVRPIGEGKESEGEEEDTTGKRPPAE